MFLVYCSYNQYPRLIFCFSRDFDSADVVPQHLRFHKVYPVFFFV